MMSDTIKNARGVERVLRAMDTSDGAGVSLKRSIGTPQLDMLDPFLMLDSLSTDKPDDYIAGFPEHPHRGFETVTYMVEGAMRHQDSMGNEGILRSGGAQWMTAGSGIVHSETPEQENGLMQGFQLWINLPAKDKMIDPRYQNMEPHELAEFAPADGAQLRLLAGSMYGQTGPINGISTNPVFVDVMLDVDAEVTVPLPEGHTAVVYVFIGDAIVAGKDVPTHHLAILKDGDGVTLKGGANGGRMLVIAARPIHEQVVRYGPFVMSSKQELMQAFDDYQNGNFVRKAAS